MDIIAQIKDREISKLVDATVAAFIPLLMAKGESIKEIPLRSFKYGPLDRHNLDIYYPPSHPSNADKASVLFFCYGGGLTTGERQLVPGIVYSNVAAYFARRGYIVVIPDYRLVPNVTYPGPAEDVRDAIRWIADAKNADNLVLNGSPAPDTNSIIITGHSAGPLHILSMMFDEKVLPLDDVLRKRIIGLALNGCPYDLSNPSGLSEAVALYYGSLETAVENSPLSLYRRLPRSAIESLPKILMVQAENEPDWLRDAGDVFHNTVKEVSGVSLGRLFGKGHNHVSISLALSTGQGEEWAEETYKWLQNLKN